MFSFFKLKKIKRGSQKNSGDLVVNFILSLLLRFMKHTSKPQDKSVTPVRSTEVKDNQKGEVNPESTPKPRGLISVVSDDKLKDATPGEILSSSSYYLM